MKKITIITILFFLAALFWLGYGIYGFTQETTTMTVLAVLALGNAVVLAGLGYFISKKKKWAYWLGMIVLSVNIILGIADELGPWDFIYLAYTAGVLVILLISRSDFKIEAPHGFSRAVSCVLKPRPFFRQGRIRLGRKGRGVSEPKSFI